MSPEEVRDSNRRLLERARQGDGAALGRLLEWFRPYLLQVAFEELDTDLQVKESPSDLVQKSFMEATANFATFLGDAPEVLQGWLRQILLNNVRDVRDHFQTEKRQISREAGPVEQVAAGSQIDVTPASDAVLRNERERIMDDALGQLPAEARQLIVMRHHQGRSFTEIAQAMNINEDTARKRWLRAIDLLRDLTRSLDPDN